jgi:hypothetical protein
VVCPSRANDLTGVPSRCTSGDLFLCVSHDRDLVAS